MIKWLKAVLWLLKNAKDIRLYAEYQKEQIEGYRSFVNHEYQKLYARSDELRDAYYKNSARLKAVEELMDRYVKAVEGGKK